MACTRDYALRMNVMEEIFEIRSCIEILANDGAVSISRVVGTQKLEIFHWIPVFTFVFQFCLDAFVGTVCLIAVSRSVSGRTCHHLEKTVGLA